ncbi:hypothetical protein C7Y47_15605 [Lysinibacillus sphaericus]|uniref:Uncharacterized protein n=1 Tax=Lysinibacillus sphaericus TaxID=1421 RepID=A0A544UDX1_LYSSH|nr:hypothetical protein [Lysinibacillus sp. SDF0037]TQR30553.1 hypothetical protein C7Y47_15605 [Lysinibacillus sp. SDF0037]
MKKKVFVVATGFTVLFSGFLISQFSKEDASESKIVSESSPTSTKLKRIDGEGKTDGFSDLDELVKKSPIIVKGTKEEDVRIEVFRSKIDESVIGGYTVADFKITEVIKNEVTNSKINLEQSILIAELNFESEGTIYSFNGYEKMNKGNEYLLFLTDEQDEVFATSGVTIGKVPLDSNELEIFEENRADSELDLIEGIFNEARIVFDN